MTERPPPERCASAARSFEEHTGRAPDGLWVAPGRVNLIGEHTDYNDGFVLPVAIDRTTVVAAARRPDDFLRCRSHQIQGVAEARVGEIGPGRTTGWSAYPLGAAWALMRRGVTLGGVDVVVDSDVPPGAGLSSSAALVCGVLLALADLHDAGLGPVDLALIGQEAEQEMTAAPVGVMDHMVAMLGRAGHALFVDTRSLEHDLVTVDLAADALRVVVIDTRVPHRLADGAYGERRSACERAAAMLGVKALRDVSAEDLEAARGRLGETLFRRARHVVNENGRVLDAVSRLRQAGVRSIGPLLGESHASLRDDFEVSVAELDLAVGAAETAGALGARLTGAGFGGSALALVPTDRYDDVRAGVLDAFARAGFGEPSIFGVETGDGAHRAA